MKTIISRAPLRVSFAGGGTDISDYSDIYGGAVLSATIDKYAYTILSENVNAFTEIIATDIDNTVILRGREDLLKDCSLPLHLEIYKYFLGVLEVDFIALRVVTFCESPAGAGLGASSTIVVSMIKAFSEFFQIYMQPKELAALAFHIERNVCKMDGGKQDQYAAAFGGFNFFEFRKNGDVSVVPLVLRNEFIAELEAMLLLFYSGKSRVSSDIISDQKSSVFSKDVNVLAALDNVKKQAYKMCEFVNEENKVGMMAAFQENWTSKKMTSKKVQTPEIEIALHKAINMGAMVGKVSGAGGGGFLMFWVPLIKRNKVIGALNSCSGMITECNFCLEGAIAWETDEWILGREREEAKNFYLNSL